MKALRTVVHDLSPEEIISFEVAFHRYLNEAYTWDLWGAAYVIHGGCSDDGFEYFRRWLVSRGRDVYEAALADPDSLAQRDMQPGPDNAWELEEIYYVARDVFEERAAKATCATIPNGRLAWAGRAWEMKRITALPSMGDRLAAIELTTSTPEELGAFIRAETDRWAPLIKQLGLKAD